MSLIDLFNPSFLAFLGILVLVAALLVVYFESKMREQNHKIASMFSIVSTLAEDLNSVKLGINQLAFNGGGPSLAENIHPFKFEQNKLIEVSDDEDEEEEDEEEDEDEDEDSGSEDSDSDSDDSDSEDNIVKVLKISDPLLENVEQNFDELEQNFDEMEQNFDDLEEDLDTEFDAETFEEEPLQLVENVFVPEEIIQNDKNDKNEKSIKIDLGEAVNDIVDYKKLTLQRLKSIVTEKGLAVDTSKLKKPDLLKLLGVE
jgi:hypothetical protein